MPAQGRTGITQAQGHVAVYARDARWRRALERSLTAAGHSHLAAADADGLREVLDRQRFDLLALKVRDDEEADALAEALNASQLPFHGILVGSFSSFRLVEGLRRGSFRYIPGRVSADELVRLIEASISAGTWDDGASENGESAATLQIEEVDIEEAIESAAAAVYRSARRRNQRFRTHVEGEATSVLADPVKLRRTLAALLELLVTVSPRGALVSVEARAGQDEWLIRSGTSARRSRSAAHMAELLQEETKTVAAASRDISEQGGLLWVEVSGGSSLCICITLPMPAGAAERRFA